MDADRQILILFSGRVTALLVASAVASFNTRTRSWWVMVAILTVAMITGPTVTILIYAAASAFALYEFLGLSAIWKRDRAALILACPQAFDAIICRPHQINHHKRADATHESGHRRWRKRNDFRRHKLCSLS